ncbi:glycosyltransferase family 4 protein [Streptomyces griseus]|uniref:glycosyltransferase family 4 protein n=1 Tax=Streptomyces griseus TaxID=1911 RepID=UPI00068EDB65|nr:glycosyltransferase [Streptomyces griseus]
MPDTIDLLSLTAPLTGADGEVTVDDEHIDRLLTELGLTEGAGRDGVDGMLRLGLDDELDEPLTMRGGGRWIRIPAPRFRTVLASALLVTALKRAGVHGTADLVLVALTPFLFDVDRVRVDTREQLVLAVLRARLDSREQVRELWEGLPGHLRHEVDLDELIELVTAMEKASAGGPRPSEGPGATGELGTAAAPRVFRGSLREASVVPAAPRRRRLRILAVADEWFPAKGGISALNRSLCRALAEAGHEVFCLLPSTSRKEIDDAGQVRLVPAPPLPGASGRDLLMRKPVLPGGLPPDVVIGHGRVSGPAAFVQAEQNFAGAARLHLVHDWPEESDRYKKAMRGVDLHARAEDRKWTDLELGRGATRVVAVGPRLHGLCVQEFSAWPEVPRPLRLDPGFDSPLVRPREPVPGPPRILLTGRMEDDAVKGLDLAARAVGHALALRDPDEPEVRLMVRGVTQGQADELYRKILEWAGRPSLNLVLRPFTTDRERLDHELRLATLVLMPSRAEGFGLVGLEAIVHGVPVLISRRSGLGELLKECLPEELLPRTVLPVTDEPERDTVRWGSAVAAVLQRPGAAFTDADTVRVVMARERTWARAAAELLDGLVPDGDEPSEGWRLTV